MDRLQVAEDLTFERVDGHLMACGPKAGVVRSPSGDVAAAVGSLLADPTAPIDDLVADALIFAPGVPQSVL
jgi:hypothetical protein